MSRTRSGKSTEGSDPSGRAGPAGRAGIDERPGRLPPVAPARGDFAAVLVMAAVAYLTAKFTAPTGAAHAAVFTAASALVVLFGRLADRLWDMTIAPVIPLPGPGLRILSRFPFRLMAGGIAFTVVMLASKRANIIPVKDVPVAEIFATGAVLAAGYFAAVEGWKRFRGSLRPGPGDTPERNDR